MTFHPDLLLGVGGRGISGLTVKPFFAFLQNLQSNKVTAEFIKRQTPYQLEVNNCSDS